MRPLLDRNGAAMLEQKQIKALIEAAVKVSESLKPLQLQADKTVRLQSLPHPAACAVR